MRILCLSAAAALALYSASASAGPIAPQLTQDGASNIVKVWGGCGRGFHPNRWGECSPNRYGFYGPRPYWQGYYGGGYPYWRDRNWYGY